MDRVDPECTKVAMSYTVHTSCGFPKFPVRFLDREIYTQGIVYVYYYNTDTSLGIQVSEFL